MANHKSAIKRIRQNRKRKLHNKYYAKTMRNALKKVSTTTKKKEAEESLPIVISMIDKAAKRNIIHKKKAANLKSKLMRQVNSM